jgi:hypothetical protein
LEPRSQEENGQGVWGSTKRQSEFIILFY